MIRTVEEVPAGYDLDPASPNLVDVRADQYRAAVLKAPGTSPIEYCVWAENTSNIALRNDPTWAISEGEGKIPPGTLSVTKNLPLPVETLSDGTSRVVVTDDGNRSIGSIAAVVLARGDVTYDDDGWVDNDDFTQGRKGSTPYIVVLPSTTDQDALAGVAKLSSVTLTLDGATGVYRQQGGGNQVLTDLAGGLSNLRGDTVVEVQYALSPARFWWTRNDRYQTRFGWNDATQRWEPLKGGHTISLGKLEFDKTYTLSPKPKGLVPGTFLPGDGSNPDAYSMIRLGNAPGAISSVGAGVGGASFTGIRVRNDRDIEKFDFSADPSIAGVVGKNSGILSFNPTYVEQHAGKIVWYVNRDFDTESSGVVGAILDSDRSPLFVSPIPGPTDFPLLTIGSRRYLTVSLETDESNFSTLNPPEGTAVVAMTTGRVKLSQADIDKSDPDKASFTKHFLGENLLYSGVALNATPQPVRKEVQTTAVTSGGVTKHFIPDMTTLPTEWAASDASRGLGVSGVINTPDGLGVIPTNPAAAVPIRPGGDIVADVNDGRVRRVRDGVSDTIVFSRKRALSVVVVDRESDLPSNPFRIPSGTAYVTRENVSFGGANRGSRVMWGRKDAKDFGNDPVFFLQADFCPATYTKEARLISKSRLVFRFPTAVVLDFTVDGAPFTWDSNAEGFTDITKAYTAAEVAATFNTLLGSPAPAQAYAQNGSVVIEAANVATGSVEIGWGGVTADLTGPASLGFLPGWRVVGGVDNWLPDSGITFGMQRSPVNQDRTREAADFNAVERLDDETLSESIPAMPFVFFDAPPLQDVAGIDEGVFFNLKTIIEGPDGVEIVDKSLEHYTDIVHRFGDKKFLWVETDTQTDKVEKATSTLGFGKANIVSESLLGAPGIGGGLYISEGGAFTFQDPRFDFLLPQSGQPGNAVLIERFGNLVLFGGRGSLTAGTAIFTDPDADFTAASDDQATNPDGTLMFDAGGAPVYLPIARVGYQLKISSGPATGNYVVTNVDINGTDLTLDPVPVVGTTRATPWSLYKGYTDAVFDPSLVADQVYKPFNHLPEEPMKVRVLSKLGATPATAAAQTAARLTADMEAAIIRNRTLSLRYGLVAATATNTATLTPLGKTELGSIANNTLIVPSTNNARFTASAFQLLVGTDLFSATPVASFAADPGGGTGIEYLQAAGADGAKGLIKFGSTLLTNYKEAVVHYVETFLAPASLAALTAEYDPETGVLNLCSADMTAFGGTTAWFVEQMITEGRLDVAISPMAGAAGFNEPIKESQAVEFEYDKADTDGSKIAKSSVTEFLPVFVRHQEATRIDDITFQYNTTGMEMDLRITPSVYVGAMLQNYGTTVDLVIEPPKTASGLGKITFLTKKIPSHIKVKVTFASFEANGGERSYTASTLPIYRPPFFIKKSKSAFGLRTDRSAEFQVGQMLRIGPSCIYVQRVFYVAASDITRIDFFPATVDEVGSRSPGNDSLSLITAGPITTAVDPDGANIATAAPAGFMQSVPISQFPFEPVEKGQATITFRGDLTAFAVPGHILEVAGMPFTIANAELNEDGTRTKITTTSPFTKGVNVKTSPTVKLTYRPLYPPEARPMLGLGPVLDSEAYEVVLFGKTNSAGSVLPGGSLVEDIEYSLDASSGGVRLLDPGHKALGPNQRVYLRHTRIRTLKPFLTKGIVGYPRIFATFLHNSLPDADNGIEGGMLSATFTYRSPDTFYCRAATLASFLGEAVKQAVDEIKGKQPAGGSVKTVIPGDNNWEKGNIGLHGEGRHLGDQDRAARTFLDYYNTACVAFEQIPEAISGGFVGDRDGKFRFFIGKGKPYPTPGYEDEITGLLERRFIWAEVFNLLNPFVDLLVFPADSVTDPFETTLSVAEGIDGPPPDADLFDRMMNLQKPLVRNDVDDEVLIGTQKPTLRFVTSFPFFVYRAGPAMSRRMGEMHRFSRLFPTETKAFLVSYPGLGANETAAEPGVFARSRTIDDEEKSTYRTEIGQLANPVHGAIENVTSAQVYQRRARARIWAYYPNGILANTFSAGVPAGAITEPCVVAFPTALNEVPMDPLTGFPDVARLLSAPGGNGTVPDLNSGDPSLATPGFAAGDQINWGEPDGKVYPGLTDDTITIAPFVPLSFTRYTALFVRDIQHGCILRFQDEAGVAITAANSVLVGTAADAGVPAHEWPIGNADTIYVVPATGGSDPFTDNKNPEVSEIAALAAVQDTFDVAWRPDGKLIDNTLPSFSDPTWFGLKEIFGQNPVTPLTHLESDVSFVAAFQNPLELPCLLGEFKDDTGDYQIPYLKGTNTELQRFTQIAVSLPGIVADVTPDEIFGSDGEVVGVAHIGDNWNHDGLSDPLLPKEAAALMTSQDMAPKTTAPAVVGLADLRSFDLLLMEVDDTETAIRSGSQGILSVGSVETRSNAGNSQGIIKPPRFVTMTTPPPRWQVELGAAAVANDVNLTGSFIKYDLENYFTFLSAYTGSTPQTAPPLGVHLEETDTTANGILDRTVLDFDNAAINLTLNDGVVTGVGGLNDFWSANPADARSNNEVNIKVYARTDVVAVNGAGAGQTNGELLLTIRFFKNGAVPSVDVIPAVGAGLGPIAVAPGDVSFGVGPNDKQIWINVPGIIDWGPAPGTPAQWYIPHVDSGPGPGRTLTTLYGFEFSFSVESSAGSAESQTGWIASDRLTLNDVLDMSGAIERGTPHPQEPATTLDTTLRVWRAQTAAGVVTVNDSVPYTFLRQSGATAPFCGGTWADKVPGTSPEQGSLEVPAFEGNGNTAIATTGLNARFAGMASSDVIAGGALTIGFCESKDNVNFPAADPVDRYDDRVTLIPIATSLANVQKGDLLVIDRSSDATHWATTKSGTWPIRYAIDPDTNDPDPLVPLAGASRHFLGVSPTEQLGYGGQMFPAFPQVKNADTVAGTLTVDTTTGFTFAGRVYVVIDPSVFGLAGVPLATFKAGLWSATFGAIATVNGNRVFTGLGAYQWADGTAVTAAELPTLPGLSRGKRITGFTSIDIRVRGASNGLPEDDSVVGWHNATGPVSRWINGIRYLSFTAPGTATVLWSADPAAPNAIIDGAVAGAGQFSVEAATGLNGHTFVNDETLPVYPRVPIRLYFNMSNAQGDDLNNNPGGLPHGGTGQTNFLIPNTTLLMESGGNSGFAAQGGIFFEAKYPRPTTDLAAIGAGQQHVVDSDHSLLGTATPDTGHRNFDDFVGVAPGTPEGVHFTVRRARRWQEYTTVTNDFLPLRFAYEIRRGRVQSYTTSDRGFATVDATGFTMNWAVGNPPSATVAKAPDIWNDGKTYTGTNLGPFGNPDVNINPGDLFRVLDDSGNLVEQVEIATVSGPGSLRLAVPGLITAPAVGQRFEVWLRQAPVPHEQSMEQLLDLVTFKAVHQTYADYAAEQGGYTPANTAGYDLVVNKFSDDHSLTGATNANGGWAAKGVRKGDILIIDPSGTIPQATERGVEPQGDRGVNGRVDGHAAGATDDLDDNRGFYRITGIDDTAIPPQLTVNPVHSFAGTGTSPVVFPDVGHPNFSDLGYAIYPTVEAPTWTANAPAAGFEGQNDLRPSMVRSPSGSYQIGYVADPVNDAAHSIRPVSYRIIRPNQMFSDEAIDLVLTVRERMLSWIEVLSGISQQRRLGPYFIWMRDNHPHDLGDLGILSNAVVQSLVGHWNYSPYLNSDNCLSILGRRFWIHDPLLDRMEPTNAVPAAADPYRGRAFVGPPNFPDPGGPYTSYTTELGGVVRPVLPDRVEEVLDNSDRLRPIRYIWLAYRTHRLLGTLASIARFEADLPERLEEQRQLALLQESTDKAETS